MSLYTGRGDFRDDAESMLAQIQIDASKYPLSFAKWLIALDFISHPIKEIAILGDPDDPATTALKEVVWSKYRPHLIFAVDKYPPGEGSPPLLVDRPLKYARPTAYVCQNFTCHQPVNSPNELIAQLNNSLSEK
jgi:uncharacterized protein YyaL (SSP411 family)